MGEHLKNMFVGLIAAHIALALAVVLVWLGMNYVLQIFLTIAFVALCGACYGLGYSLRQKWKRPTPEGER